MILRTTFVLAAVVGLMSLPRFLAMGRPILSPDVALFLLLLPLVADAPAAWGTLAGMGGVLPERRRLATGLLLAVGCGAILVPMQLATDAAYRAALVAAGRGDLAATAFPAEMGHLVAAILWAGGFEVLFFYAFVMSLMARVTGRAWLAVGVAVALRTLVSVRQLHAAGVLVASLPALGVGATASLCVALVFVRGGLPAASALAVLVKARLLVALL